MNENQLKELLEKVKNGELETTRAFDLLKELPFTDLGYAHVDTHRNIRRGFPEVIFGEGKKKEHIRKIFSTLAQSAPNVMVTRCNPDVVASVQEDYPDAEYHDVARLLALKRNKKIVGQGVISVVTAGTLDIPVAEEAALTAEIMGNEVHRIYDVGVAGLHRILAYQKKLAESRVAIVVAGMEGALPSVVGGLLSIPIIAVPTSVGYGTSFGGLTALFGMLNSCAAGVVVVNIDNGFGAAYAASLINRRTKD